MKFIKKKSITLHDGKTYELINAETKEQTAKRLTKPFWQLSDGISQSMLQEFLSCKERARLNYKLGWTSVSTSNAITFGMLAHSCLESVYKHIQAGKKPDGEKYYENTINFYLQEYKKLIGAERLWTPEDEQALQLNAGYLHTLLPAYFKKYLEIDSKRKYLAVEEEFRNTWTGNIPFRGKIDIVYEVNGEIWIMDHKTKYSFDDGTEDRLSFDFQGMFYILNWWLKTGKMPSGFVHNMIQRPRLRQGKKENLKEFIDRLKEDVDAGEKTNTSYFKRIQTPIKQAEFDFWFNKEFKPIMDEFCGWAADLTPNYRNPASCSTRFGVCKYVKVCGLKDYVGLFRRKTVFQELAL